MVHELTFCEDSHVWAFYETWFSPFSRCFEWTVLCYVPFFYLLLGSCAWIYSFYYRCDDNEEDRPRKRSSVWTPLQLTRATLCFTLMLVFFLASVFGEIKFYGALYAENRGEKVSVGGGRRQSLRFVPLASILYDIVNWLACIVVAILHHLHRDVGRETSRTLVTYWSLMVIFHLPPYYRTWMDIVQPSVNSNMSMKSVILHTITYPLMIASLAINIVMNKRQVRPPAYEKIPGYNRRRSMTR